MNNHPPATAVGESKRPAAAFDLCSFKIRKNIKLLADEPKAWTNDVAGNYFNHNENFHDIGNWTSSFFTGMALLAGRATKDEYFLNQAQRLAPFYREKAFTRHLNTHHDLGFLYSLYSVALHKLTGDKQHREVGLRAAELLAQRFNEQGNFIRAWGHMNTTEHDNMAIVDSLMNLPLLYWAAQESGDEKYHKIAVRHADTMLKNFIRPDDSVCHAFRFDLQTGQPLGPDNYCGFAVDSYWARGATWAIYGFALSYRYTRDPKYLQASIRLANKFIAQLDAEVVPLWDFRLTPAAPHIRDSSAAAVMICGIQELARHQAANAPLLKIKNALLARLGSVDYLDSNPASHGILKNAQVGISGPGTAKSVYTSWGDYFLMEALANELGHGEVFW